MSVSVEQYGDGCVVVRLNRPEAANAVDDAITREMQRVVAETEADPDVQVVILGSTHPKVFCAGADLRLIAEGRTHELFPAGPGFAGFVRAARSKPWIAMVGGAARAGGTELALACDLIVASTAASFGLPEPVHGLAALAGGLQRLPRRVPPAVALDMILSGEPVDARRAFDIGLVSRIAEPGQLLETCLALARTIAANAPGAVRDSLALARLSLSDGEDAAWAATPDFDRRRLSSPEVVEGLKAFKEGRRARWNRRPDTGPGAAR